VQTGEVVGRGIEAEARGSIDRNIDFVAAYTFQETEITKSNTLTELGKRPIQLPEHSASAWANYTFREGSFAGLGIGFGVRYFGTTYANTANTISVPSVTLYDAGLQYDLSYLGRDWKGYSLSVNASNLFDKTYVASCGAGFTGSPDAACYWGVERTVEATLRYRW
jgi:iron complex outermembrane receptor protein